MMTTPEKTYAIRKHLKNAAIELDSAIKVLGDSETQDAYNLSGCLIDACESIDEALECYTTFLFSE